MKKFIWIIPVLLLVGCNEYTSQICTEDVRTDVQGLEGNWKFVGYNQPELQVTQSNAQLKRLAKGVYLASGKKEALFTCELGGKTYLEQQQANGRWQAFQLTPNGKGFDLTITVFDKAAVEASGVPFTVEEPEEGSKLLILDNAKISDPKKAAELLVSSSFLIRMY